MHEQSLMSREFSGNELPSRVRIMTIVSHPSEHPAMHRENQRSHRLDQRCFDGLFLYNGV